MRLSPFVLIFCFSVSIFSQTPVSTLPQTPVKLTSAELVGDDGLTVERLVERGAARRADLLAARERLTIAEGRLQQARLRPNPTLEAEYGSPRFLGGEAERDFSVGVAQTFELGGKRRKRAAVAELEVARTRAEIFALERQIGAEIRAAYTNALGVARRLDVLEKLAASDEELVRVTDARLREGDAAPLDANLVRVENDRLRVQIIQAKSELDTEFLRLKSLIGADAAEALKIAPQTERPPRLDLTLNDLTGLALKERADLKAARLGEEIGAARIDLAKSGSVPNVEGSVKYSGGKSIIDLPPSLGVSPFPQREREITFGVAVEIPVFNRNQGEIASAAGERVQAMRQREFLETLIRRDVAVAYRRYRAAAEALVLYSTQIMPRAEENFRSVRAAYGLGEFSVFDVVSEQRRLTENVTAYNQSLRDYYAALAELEAAIGAPLPAAGFAPVSVLPGDGGTPNRTDRADFLKPTEKTELSKKVLEEKKQ